MAADRSVYEGIVWMLVAALCLSAVTEARRFEHYSKDVAHKLCSIIDAEFTINVTAEDKKTGEKETVRTLASHDIDLYVGGDCKNTIYIQWGWPLNVSWTAKQIYPGGLIQTKKPLIEFTFDLKSSFREIHSEGSKQAVLPNIKHSFRCSSGYEDHYYITNYSGEITYDVLVNVSYIQIQLVNIKDSDFSEAGTECLFRHHPKPPPPKPTPTPPKPTSPTRQELKKWLIPVVLTSVVVVSCVVVGLGYVFCCRPRRA